MFVESRSGRPTNLSSRQELKNSLTLDQVKFSKWEYIFYQALIFGSGFSLPHQNKKLKKLAKIFGYCGLFFLAGLPTPANSQTFDPLTPETPDVPEPKPLPNQKSPLDESLVAPPIPESLIDIPGTIVVEQFQFDGGTAFEQTELNQAIANFIGKPITFAQLVQAANEITKLYVSQGYITSGAYLPEQNLNTGTVQIQIVEGSLSEIDVNLLKGRLTENYIRDRIEQKLTTPLNINQLQSALQLLQLNPLIESLDAELSTGIEPGTNALSISVTGADTFALQARLNNNRNPSVGSFERGIRLEENNLYGIGDSIYFAFNNTDGSNQYRGGYLLPINTRDGSISFDFSLAKNEIIEFPFDEVDIDVNSDNYDLTWRQPIFQKATAQVSQELALSFGGSLRESNTSLMDSPEGISPGADENGEIRTSTLNFSQEWLRRDRNQVISARSQFNLGINAFNATTDNSEPDGQFFSWRGQASYLRLLSEFKGTPSVGSTLLLRSELQLAADPLIPTEQFSLGGVATVRGYRQDTLLADNGFSGSAELRVPIARLPKINASLQLSPFIDFGTGWNTDGEESEFNTLLGTGFGVLLQTDNNLSARIDWGIPLINTESSDNTLQENGVYFQLEYNLF